MFCIGEARGKPQGALRPKPQHRPKIVKLKICDLLNYVYVCVCVFYYQLLIILLIF